jgi:hypothetical protein
VFDSVTVFVFGGILLKLLIKGQSNFIIIFGIFVG